MWPPSGQGATDKHPPSWFTIIWSDDMTVESFWHQCSCSNKVLVSVWNPFKTGPRSGTRWTPSRKDKQCGVPVDEGLSWHSGNSSDIYQRCSQWKNIMTWTSRWRTEASQLECHDSSDWKEERTLLLRNVCYVETGSKCSVKRRLKTRRHSGSILLETIN